mmetsp:Transcript_15505/g.54343  ORF Transcript_15505/g.54343 Transcript_15505/m.54343 type:complete len:219 (+) Transcript_15505:134-790(+)
MWRAARSPSRAYFFGNLGWPRSQAANDDPHGVWRPLCRQPGGCLLQPPHGAGAAAHLRPSAGRRGGVRSLCWMLPGGVADRRQDGGAARRRHRAQCRGGAVRSAELGVAGEAEPGASRPSVGAPRRRSDFCAGLAARQLPQSAGPTAQRQDRRGRWPVGRRVFGLPFAVVETWRYLPLVRLRRRLGVPDLRAFHIENITGCRQVRPNMYRDPVCCSEQ